MPNRTRYVIAPDGRVIYAHSAMAAKGCRQHARGGEELARSVEVMHRTSLSASSLMSVLESLSFLQPPDPNRARASAIAFCKAWSAGTSTSGLTPLPSQSVRVMGLIDRPLGKAST